MTDPYDKLQHAIQSKAETNIKLLQPLCHFFKSYSDAHNIYPKDKNGNKTRLPNYYPYIHFRERFAIHKELKLAQSYIEIGISNTRDGNIYSYSDAFQPHLKWGVKIEIIENIGSEGDNNKENKVFETINNLASENDEWFYKLSFRWEYNKRIQFKAAQILYDESDPKNLECLIHSLPKVILFGSNEQEKLQNLIIEILTLFPKIVADDPDNFDKYNEPIIEANKFLDEVNREKKDREETERQMAKTQKEDAGCIILIGIIIIGLISFILSTVFL